MIKLLRRMILAITYSDQLEELVKEMQRAKEDEVRLSRGMNLNLCLKHQQERNGSHYAEHNCDHCKLEEQLKVSNAKVVSLAEEKCEILTTHVPSVYLRPS